MRFLPAALVALAVAATAAVFAEGALAEPPFFATCGVIRAFTPPSATAGGSITIADRTFAVTSRDRMAGAVVGNTVCLNQTVTTSGPAFELVSLPSPACGEVNAVGAASLDLFIQPSLHVTLGFGSGFSFKDPGRAVVACFETGLDASGRVVAVRSVASAPSKAPATGPSTLPSTSTAEPFAAPAGALEAIAVAIVVWLSVRVAGARASRP
jgi:hypothetical protein